MKNLTWQNPEQLFVAQELINKVKSKCCGIKDNVKTDVTSKGLQIKDPCQQVRIYWNLINAPVVVVKI